MIEPSSLPGLFITATDTGVGKTMIAAAIAEWFWQQRSRVAVLKPVATGCEHAREGLVSEDAELLAAASRTRHPLDLICPNRYAEPLAPSVAAKRVGLPVDAAAIDRSVRLMSGDADVLIVEGAGGVFTPLDRTHTVLDLLIGLRLPAVVVARPGLGTINHTVLTTRALRAAGVTVAGVVINRYPPDTAGVVEETNPAEIERIGDVPVLCLVPEETVAAPNIPPGVAAAVAQVDWHALAAVRTIRPR